MSPGLKTNTKRRRETFVLLTFPFDLSTETLDEGEDEEDDEGGHADPSERVSGACKQSNKCKLSHRTRTNINLNLCETESPEMFSRHTKVVDEDSAHHGATAAAQAEVQALQDALRRCPEGWGDRCAQVGDAGGPN